MVFFSINSILFASGNHYWNYGEVNFYRKTSLPLIETVFQASEKWFLPFTRYSRQWKKFLPQMGTFFFLTNLSFRLVKMNFLSSRNSLVLFRTMLKILKFRGSNHFKKLISWPMEVNFSDTPSSEGYFLSSGNGFLNRLFHSVWWRRIFCLVETVFSYLIFFLNWKLSL